MNRNKLVAYLIIAHEQPEHFADLVAQLQHEQVSFFVHIDKKADIQPFQAGVSQYENVFFVEQRIAVHWGAFSLVRATLGLLRAVTESETRFKYCVLLSGVCYPIQSNKHILDFYRDNDTDLIAYTPEVFQLQYHKYRAFYGRVVAALYNLRLTRWLHQKKPGVCAEPAATSSAGAGAAPSNGQKGTLATVAASAPATSGEQKGTLATAPRPRRWSLLRAVSKKALWYRGYWYEHELYHMMKTRYYYFKYNLLGSDSTSKLDIPENLLNLILPVKKPPARLRLYVGAQWWSLRYDTATALYRFLTDKKNRDIMNFYRYSLCSDERIFHSVIASGLLGDEPPAPQKYTRFQVGNNGKLADLTLDHLADIQQSDALFARKFDYVNSAELKRELAKSIGDS